jgi:hypothetical protein
MATGMSADPIELVMFQPRAKDEAVAYKRKADPRAAFSVLIIEIRAKAFNTPKGRFKYRFMGRSRVHLIPESLMKAAIDPVKVTPPIKVPM